MTGFRTALIAGCLLGATPALAAADVTVTPCPHDGCFWRLAVGANGSLHLVFRRDEELDLYGSVTRKIPAPGARSVRERPALASNARGEVLLVWSDADGRVAWQVYDAAGTPTPDAEGTAVPEGRRWPAPAAYATPAGDFVVVC